MEWMLNICALLLPFLFTCSNSAASVTAVRCIMGKKFHAEGCVHTWEFVFFVIDINKHWFGCGWMSWCVRGSQKDFQDHVEKDRLLIGQFFSYPWQISLFQKATLLTPHLWLHTCSSSHFVLLAKNVIAAGYTLDDVILFTSLCSLVRWRLILCDVQVSRCQSRTKWRGF